MNAEVALIGFPRLQEQIAARVLGLIDLRVEKVTYDQAAAKLENFRLALYFWPDGVETAVQRIRSLRAQTNTPVLIVAARAGQYAAQKSMGEDVEDILTMPLQAEDVARKLARFAGSVTPRDAVSLDAGFINPFVSGTVDTMLNLAGMHCQRTGLRLADNEQIDGGYSGTIELSGNTDGFVSVVFSKDLAHTVSGKVHKSDSASLSEDQICSGLSEFMNLVAGAAKAELNDSRQSFSMSTPQVTCGCVNTTVLSNGTPLFVIEFAADGEPFTMLVCLRDKSA